MPPPTTQILTTMENDIALLSIPSHHPAYHATKSFLQWDLDSDAGRVTIPYYIAILTFLPSCDFAKGPEHTAPLDGVNMLQFNLTDAAKFQQLRDRDQQLMARARRPKKAPV